MIIGRTHDISAITFGKAKEGSMEAYNFSSVQSVTSTHSTNEKKKKTNSDALVRSLAKSVFSIDTGTSKVTTDDTEDDMNSSDNEDSSKISNNDTKATGIEVAIERMGVLARNTGR